MNINYWIARMIRFFGIKPFVSTGICGGITFGYGKLDGNGYWQFPLYYICEDEDVDWDDLRRRKLI